MSEVEVEVEVQDKKRITGRVKWFNNKAGFGFITACEGPLKDKDIFVHYSSISVPDDQYKYLIQGEYVDFETSRSDKSNHEFHAVNISGVKGGTLMCETRKQTSVSSSYRPRVYKTPDETEPDSLRKKSGSEKSTKRVSNDGYTKVSSRKPRANK